MGKVAVKKKTEKKSSKKPEPKRAPAKAQKPQKATAKREPTTKMEPPKATGPMDLREISVGDLRPGPWQYRKFFDQKALDELTASIRARGVLSPICARPSPSGGFEIVFGERRWRAACAAGLKGIATIVRELNDEEAYDEALEENLKRVDPHPLDESDALVEMRRRHDLTIERLAARVGKGVPYVAARLALEHLGDRGRKAMMLGVIGIEAARAFAAIRDPELQDAAIDELTDGHDAEDPVLVREVKEEVRGRFLLHLSTAPFDTTDGTFSGGACQSCPKRSGNQQALFDLHDATDLCLSPKCWSTKLDEQWARVVKSAKSEGWQIIGPEEAKALFPYGARVSHAQWQDLDEPKHENGNRSWSALLGEVRERELLKRRAIAYARSPSGSIHRVAKRADIERVIADHPRSTDPDHLKPQVDDETPKPKKAKSKKPEGETEIPKWKVEARARRVAIGMAIAHAREESTGTTPLLRAAVRSELIGYDASPFYDESLVERFWGLLEYETPPKDDEETAKAIESLDAINLQIALFALLFWNGVEEDDFKGLGGVDFERARKVAEAELRAAEDAPPDGEDDGDGEPTDEGEDE